MRRLEHLVPSLLMVALTGCATGSHAAPPEAPIDSEYDEEGFRQGDESERTATLDDHGEWIASDDYGRVWRPVGVATGWRPYSRGRWTYRGSAWTWVSDYPWGWVAFHYGRWVFDPFYGWVWVPGNTWGPAWVAWTYSDSYIGWAPLPPYATVGGTWVGNVPSAYWCFARRRSFRRRRFRPRLAPVRRNAYIARRSRPRRATGFRPVPRAEPRVTTRRSTPLQRGGASAVSGRARGTQRSSAVKGGRSATPRRVTVPARKNGGRRITSPARTRGRQVKATSGQSRRRAAPAKAVKKVSRPTRSNRKVRNESKNRSSERRSRSSRSRSRESRRQRR